MGKRKKSSRKTQGPRKREGLPTVFQCLFCNHELSVVVKMEKKQGVGQLHCKVCGQSFQSTVNYLSEPVDVYYDWVDACDQVEKEERGATGSASKTRLSSSALGARAVGRGQATAEVEDDGFIVDDEVDGEADYAG